MNKKRTPKENPLSNKPHPENQLKGFAQAFSQNESFFKKLVEFAPMGVTLSSSDRKLSYANHTFSQIIGYSQEELLGLDWSQITYKEDQGQNLELYNDLLEGKSDSFNLEKRYFHKKGHLIWCRLLVSLIADEEGQSMIIAFIEDITAEKANQDMLKQQAAMIQVGESVAKMGTIIWNIENNETEASPGIFSIYELDPAATLPEDLFTKVMRLTHPEDVDMLRADVERSAREKVLIPTNYRIQFPDGRVKWLKTSPGGFLDDRRMLRTIQDVSEDRKKNELLKEQSDMIHLGEELAKTATLVWDTETREIEASPGIFSIYELSPNTSTKENLMDQMFGRIHPKDLELVEGNMKIMAEERVQRSMSYRLQFPDGRIKWVKTGSGKFLDGNRKLAIIQEVTEEKEKSLVLERQAETIQLGEYVAKTGTFVWNIYTRETEVSPGFMNITELDPETSNRKNYFQKTLDRIHTEDLPSVLEKIKRVVEEKAQLEFEFRLTFPDGRIKWIKTSPGEFLEDNRKLGILQDITREKSRSQLLENQAGMIRLGEQVAKTGTAIWDTDTLETEASPGLYSIFEFDSKTTNKQNLFSKILERIHPEDLPSVQESIEGIMKEEILVDFDYRIQFPDGRIKWIKEVSGDFMDDRRLLAIVHDITEDKVKESLVNRQSDIIRMGEDLGKTGTVIWNTKTSESEPSPGLYSIYELDPETTNGKNIFHTSVALTHPDDLDLVNRHIELITSRKEIKGFEYRILLPNGKMKWIKAAFGDFLDAERILVIIQDITEAKEKNLLLDRQGEMIRLGEKVAQTGTALLDIETLETEVSPGLYAIFELDPEMTNSQNVYSKAMGMIHPEDLPSIQKKAELLLKERVLEDMEYRIQMPDGRIKWIKGVSGDFIDDKRIIGIVHDITSLKEQTLKLTDANKEMEQLMYTVSHDLRAPLRHVSSYAQMVRDKSSHKLDEKENKYLTNVIQASARLGDMIDELLQYFRNRNVAIKKTVIKVNDMIHSTKELFTQDTLDRDITWEIGTIPDIYADTVMVEKVFLNLLSNAVKFTAKTKKPIIRISGEKVGKFVEIQVADNGAGFKMKYINKIFAVFQRLHKRSDFEGTGIGLSNVQRIILRHGGSIWAEGEVDKGATFYFTLPSA